MDIHRKLALIIGVVTAVWTFASLFAAALQCRASYAWELLDSQCSQQVGLTFSPEVVVLRTNKWIETQTAFWNFYGVINIITEIALIALPIYTIWDVHISQTRKVAVAACFSARVL